MNGSVEGNWHRLPDIPIQEIEHCPSRRRRQYEAKLRAGLIPDDPPNPGDWIGRG
jgi:hypothetical protein